MMWILQEVVDEKHSNMIQYLMNHLLLMYCPNGGFKYRSATISLIMCRRVVQVRSPIRYATVAGLHVRDNRSTIIRVATMAAPPQELLVIRHNHQTDERPLAPLSGKWGLISSWSTDAQGGRKSINAKSEAVAQLPTFREAYRKRRCILPVYGF
jgi:putative SOS response-associated peptidase YedK